MVSEIPQYLRQLSNISSFTPVQVDTSSGDLLRGVSGAFAEYNANITKKARDNERLRAKATMQTEMARIYRENESNPEGLQQSLNNFKKGFLGQITDAELANEFSSVYDIASVPYIDRAYGNYAKIVDTENEKLTQSAYVGLIQNIADNVKALQSPIPEHSQAAFNALQDNFKDSAELAVSRRSDGQYMFTADQQLELAGAAQAAALRGLPLNERMIAIDPPTGFEANFALVMQAELDPRDPDKIHPDGDGSLAKYGINSAANPEIDLQSLTFEGAMQIYKERYWNPLNIDSLPANVQGIIFDAAVNQGPGYAKKLIKSFEQGAGPSELLQMRRERYAKTKGEDFEKASWANRIKKYEPLALTEFTDSMPYDLSLKLKEEAGKEFQKIQELRRSDPGAYFDQVGVPYDQRVVEQGGKRYAVILSNDTAKQMVEQANGLVNVDDVYQFAAGLKQMSGDNYDVVMRDLRRQKLNPRVESAINLANLNAATYKEHIELFMQSYLMDQSLESESKLDGQFEMAGHNKDVFMADIQNEIEELRQLMTLEGRNQVEISNEMIAYSQMAMARAIKTGDTGEAIQFAVQPLNAGHNKISVGGNVVRVPYQYNRDVMEKRLNFAYDDIIKIIKADKNKDGEFFDSDDVIPALNADQTGIIFRDILGTPLMNKDGIPYTIDFEEMATTEYYQEKTKIFHISNKVSEANRRRK